MKTAWFRTITSWFLSIYCTCRLEENTYPSCSVFFPGPLIEKDNILRVMQNACLVLHVYCEKLNKNSFWKPYLGILLRAIARILLFLIFFNCWKFLGFLILTFQWKKWALTTGTWITFSDTTQTLPYFYKPSSRRDWLWEMASSMPSAHKLHNPSSDEGICLPWLSQVEFKLFNFGMQAP